MGITFRGEHKGEVENLKRTILVVEDSPTQAAQIRALLVANGLKVLLARDGQEGIDMAEQFTPGLIILDWELPVMNGGEVARVLKNKTMTKKIPIIIFTRYDQAEIVSAGFKEGAVDFIPKDAFAKVVMVETLKQMGFIKPAQQLSSY